MSSGNISNDLDISRSSVQRIFKANEYHNYKYHIKNYFRANTSKRMLFCERLKAQVHEASLSTKFSTCSVTNYLAYGNHVLPSAARLG